MKQRLNRLTRVDIERTAKDLQPDTVKIWWVEVAGKRFPVKQLVREAANRLRMPGAPLVPRNTKFTTDVARKVLEDNGFRPVDGPREHAARGGAIDVGAAIAEPSMQGPMQQAVFVDEMFKAVRFVRADGRVGLQCPMCTFGRPLMQVPENAPPTTCMQCGKRLELRPNVPVGDP